MKLLTYKQLTEQSQEVIDNVNKCFENYLADDIVKLNSQAREVEAWYGNVLFLLPQAEYYYRRKQQVSLKDLIASSEKRPTEYDKEIFINSEVAEERSLRDTLKNMSESIKQRISLCQTILKSNTMDRGIHE